MRRFVPLAGLLLMVLPACPGPSAPAASPGAETAVTTRLSPGPRPSATASPLTQKGPGPTPSPAATAAPSATPPGSGFASPTPGPAGPGSVGFTLAFSAASGDNADRSAFNALKTSGTWVPATEAQPLDTLTLLGENQGKKLRSFTLGLHLKPTVGKTYAVANNPRIVEAATLRYTEFETFVTWAWLAKAGSVEVTAVEGTRVSFKLTGVALAPEVGNTAAKGTFSVDGTATADVSGL